MIEKLSTSVRLEGKTVIVTGAGRGIGASIVALTGKQDAHVILANADVVASRSNAEIIRHQGGSADARFDDAIGPAGNTRRER
jgi:NAD(P)-dependent dehydrogenase (short-subunit alcohol dehydrogenase family)